MGNLSSAGKMPPSKGVPSGPWMRASQIKQIVFAYWSCGDTVWWIHQKRLVLLKEAFRRDVCGHGRDEEWLAGRVNAQIDTTCWMMWWVGDEILDLLTRRCLYEGTLIGSLPSEVNLSDNTCLHTTIIIRSAY